MISIKEDTNLVNLRGELDDNLEFSHEIFGEKFYNTKIKINRLSESYDVLPITVSERLLQDIDFENNKFVSVVGQLRSYNKNINNKNRLVLTVFAREITDLLVAINRPYNKSDYIPSIVWGRNAKFAKSLKIGDRIQMWGRVQSREYEKKIDDGQVLKKVAYEVSISKIKKTSENNNE